MLHRFLEKGGQSSSIFINNELQKNWKLVDFDKFSFFWQQIIATKKEVMAHKMHQYMV